MKNHYCQGSQNEMIFHHYDQHSGRSVLVLLHLQEGEEVSQQEVSFPNEHGHEDTHTHTHIHTPLEINHVIIIQDCL